MYRPDLGIDMVRGRRSGPPGFTVGAWLSQPPRPSRSLSPPLLPFPLFPSLSRYPCDLPQPFCLSLKEEVEKEDGSGRGKGGEVWEGEGEGRKE
jgi:hypothetical protein